MRTAKSPDERKSEIIRAAKELFIRQGVDQTSVSQIVKEIGVAQGLFYYYFRSKDEVVAAVVDSVLDECEENLRHYSLHPSEDFYTNIREFIIIFGSFYQTLCCKLNYPMLNYGLKSKIHQRILQLLMDYTANLLDQGVKENYIRLQYPAFMHRLIITGLWELVENGVNDPEILLTLAEQGFGLKPHSLELPKEQLEMAGRQMHELY